MAVILRMVRHGSKHRPFYHLVATDSRKKLTSMFLERIGVYDPLGETHLAVDAAAAQRWLRCGATLLPTVRKLLKRAGVKLDGSGVVEKVEAAA